MRQMVISVLEPALGCEQVVEAHPTVSGRDPVGRQAVQQFACIAPGDFELGKGAKIDHARGFTRRFRLGHRILMPSLMAPAVFSRLRPPLRN